MATYNVNRSVTDQFYRYKMPRLVAKVEGKGNGIKTVIVNMTDIAKALSRPPTYPTKYFGCELGAQTQFDARHDRYIVNGAHNDTRLQELLDGFIRKFVLCPECDNPETNLAVFAKKGVILQRCIACGFQANIDMRHKLTTFILKNPPDVEQSTAAKGKKDKKGKKDGEAAGEPDSTNGHDESLPAPREAKDDADEDWGEDVSEEAVQQRLQGLSMAAKSMAFSDELEKTAQERIDLFYEFFKAKKAEQRVDGAENEKAIVSEAERLEVKDKATLILCELLLTANILAELKQHRCLFLRFTANNVKAQKYLLGGLEQVVAANQDVLLPKVAHVLKACYDLDVLEEDVILDWDKKVSKKYVAKDLARAIHENAAKFVQWLKEAEEEDESSEDEEDVEIVYSNTEKVGTQKVAPSSTKAATAGGGEADDIDIDNI